MSERDDRSFIDPARMQEILRHRLTRRSMMKGAGMGVAGISLASLLAACGGGGESVNPKDIFGGEPLDKVNFANWPLYIDQAKDNDGNPYYPSLKQFTDATGIGNSVHAGAPLEHGISLVVCSGGVMPSGRQHSEPAPWGGTPDLLLR